MSDDRIASDQEKDPSAIVIERQCKENEARASARTALRPSLQSALTIKEYVPHFGELGLVYLIDELRKQIGQSKDGNLERAEAMLTTQAHTLDAIFNDLARRAIHADYISALDSYLKLGLRAQSQCRATWETLAMIKNPVGRAYVNQANFAQNQQVNNSAEPSRARENQNLPNRLLEKTDGERLDFGKAATPVNADSDLEAVGEINRADIARGAT